MDERLKANLTAINGIAGNRVKLYSRLGLDTVYDFMTFFPRNYLDLSNPCKISAAPFDEPTVIRAKVLTKKGAQNVRKGLSIFKLTACDDSGNVIITFFNTKYTFDKIEIGGEYCFFGKISGNPLKREMNSPALFELSEGAVLPTYRLTEGLSNKMVQMNMRKALKGFLEYFYDPLPEAVREEFKLAHLQYSLQNIHFPADNDALLLAKRRLAFQELLILQLGLLKLSNQQKRPTEIRLKETDLTPFLSALPFTLTEGQKAAINDCIADMTTEYPMNRLLQGDVGSGKTMVAAGLSYLCAKNGFQTAVMAPTQILAEQHYHTFSEVFSKLGISVCLLTGGMKVSEKNELIQRIRDGHYDVVIGTHALVREDVEFNSLGLVVTDEQHRFGVAQRGNLADKGENPHLLVMSATPIPRTLALIIYGDLQISAIRELPKGRQAVDTLVIDSSKRARALNFIKDALDRGEQAYIVCPMIDEGSDVISVEEYLKQLKNTPLADYPIGILHGRLKAREKEELMRQFSQNEIKLLISTTVIEVGVDVPNSTIMMIENAERFGLSQLHQLRGRVGRGSKKSYCILVSDNDSEENKIRLKTMKATNDGFQIAEQDLKLRGPGDFFGFKQHGLPELKLASLYNDMEMLYETQRLAKRILAADSALELQKNFGLKELVDELFERNGQTVMN